MINSYTIWLTDKNGVRIQPIDNFIDAGGALSYVRSVNAVSPLQIALPVPNYSYLFDDPQMWVDSRLEVWRRVGQGPEYLDTETIWFVRNVKKNLTQNTFVVTAYSANELLTRAIVAYAAGSSQAEKTATIDNMMKAIVRENLGASAIAARQRTNFNVQADITAGTSTTKAFSYRNVSDVLQDLAQESATTSVPIFFDVVGVTNVDGVAYIEFRTYANQRGQDRTEGGGGSVVYFSQTDDTLGNIEITYDYTSEVNAAYVGGAGQEDVRLVVSSTDDARVLTSPINRRESFSSYSNSDVSAILTSAAKSVLRDGRPKKIITADIQNNAKAIYGRDWFWGDRGTAIVGNDIFDAYIVAVQVTVSSAGEDIRANVRSEV